MSQQKNKTGIIATLGPVSETKEVLEKMITNGLTVIRLNMSHGTHDEHEKRIIVARAAARKLNKDIKVLVDLGGPKIRVGHMEDDVFLKKGQKITLSTKIFLGTSSRFSISYKQLPKEIKTGQTILINDGKINLKVVATNNKDEIECTIVVGGFLTSRKGMNVPGAYLHVSAISTKDKKDLQFAIKHHADYIAVSFVRTPKDLAYVRKVLKENNSQAQIVSKIETQEAIESLESIVKVSDVVMVARGDLAIEIGFKKVPVEQKHIFILGKKYNKPVIVATEVLSSMEKSPIPTRAEVSDIAGAVFDGASFVMLSGETTVGDYPVESVSVIQQVAIEVESYVKELGSLK